MGCCTRSLRAAGAMMTMMMMMIFTLVREATFSRMDVCVYALGIEREIFQRRT